MDNQIAVGVLKSCLALASIWALVYLLWRPYRIDEFRHRLFGLRHELFAFAAAGNISFSDPAYIDLRNRINEMIRFAHRLTLTRFLFTFRRGPFLLRSTEKWQEKVDNVPNPETRKSLLEMHAKMIVLALGHLLSGAP